MRDFNQQLKAYSDEIKNTRCPYSEAELDREIRRAIGDTRTGVPPCTPNNNDRNGVPPCTPKDAMSHKKIPLWPASAAAAIIAAIVIPTVMFTSKCGTVGNISPMFVDGEEIYFACNNGCSADATIETFKTLLR